MTKKYPRIAVDIFAINDNLEFVLISRKNEPFKNYWALPGGFIEYGETAEQAAIREMKEETGLDVQVIDLVGVYSDPKRDPRGHVISITFLAKIIGGTLKASTDAKIAKFFKTPPEKLAFDHKKIIEDALFKLKTLYSEKL
ncbi:MAG: NUDIX domain-containing protein [Candidatus Asgardarchaeia archaeon]|nr:NUDIX hydrolase [Candidatus Odinarchaeota archaeon]